jgi:hypothetical protein
MFGKKKLRSWGSAKNNVHLPSVTKLRYFIERNLDPFLEEKILAGKNSQQAVGNPEMEFGGKTDICIILVIWQEETTILSEENILAGKNSQRAVGNPEMQFGGKTDICKSLIIWQKKPIYFCRRNCFGGKK